MKQISPDWINAVAKSIGGISYQTAEETIRTVLECMPTSAEQQPVAPFGYFHELLDHEGKGQGIWLGCNDKQVVEQAYIEGEVGTEIITLYSAPQSIQPVSALTGAVIALQRYDYESNWPGEGGDIRPDANGQYVRLDDVRSLLSATSQPSEYCPECGDMGHWPNSTCSMSLAVQEAEIRRKALEEAAKEIESYEYMMDREECAAAIRALASDDGAAQAPAVQKGGAK